MVTTDKPSAPVTPADQDPGGQDATESFDEFRNSFFCGSRTDLFHKWFKAGPEEIADEYLQELLRLTGQLIDDGDTEPIVEVIVLAQSKAYAGAGHFVYDTGPFATL